MKHDKVSKWAATFANFFYLFSTMIAIVYNTVIQYSNEESNKGKMN